MIYNVSWIFLAIAVLELGLGYSQIQRHNAFKEIDVDDHTYGRVLRPGVYHANKTYGFGTRTIYDVIYSVDRNGLRASPMQGAGKPVFFFGCSFTFGEGVNDNETLPVSFSALSGTRAINFGISGNSPNSILRMLELDFPLKVEPESPGSIVYVAIPDHIRRAAAFYDWTKGMPHYESNGGLANYVGMYPAPEPITIFDRVFKQSAIYNAVKAYSRVPAGPSSDWDRGRYISIVRKMNLLAKERYNAEFIVVLWDEDLEKFQVGLRQDADWIDRELRDSGIPVLRLQGWDRFLTRDGHPDADGNRLAARELLAFMAGRPEVASKSIAPAKAQ